MDTRRINRLGIAFIIVGCLFMVSSILFGYDVFDVYFHRVEVSGTVENIDMKKGVTKIRYDAKGETVTNELYLLDSSYRVGTEVKVYYHKNKPEESYIKPQFTFTLFYLIIGVCFIALGVVFVVKTTLVMKRM
jgi:hypothetical protein